MSYDYSENILIQESAGHLLADELGWQVELAYNQEILGTNGTFGRNSYKDILLVRYFHKALRTLNPWITDEQVIEAQNIFEKHLSSASLVQINEEKYAYIRDGIPVTEKKPNGQTEEKRAMIIDFLHPNDMERNHFLAVKEMKIYGDLYRRRTDIVGFVNGIPLLFIELKKNSVDVQNAYTDNYTDYLDTIPQLFYYNAFLMLSNGVEAKVGTLGSKYEFFHEWKRLSEQEQGSVALETMLRGICKKENFLDLLEDFILFDHSGGKTVKILARNHQYLGVNEAVRAYEARKLNNGKLGVFWHTQGSGKSYSMVFLSQKIRRKFAGSPTIVVLTDREELNSQISDTFENCGLLGKTKASKFIATSGEDLINKLKGNPSFIFTLIQKFNKKVDEPIIPDHDIIIMSDEAHRSQYGVFADNMVGLLPTASRIGFTGTPLLSNDNITERTFGGYISIYDFKRAVEDKATVPLYYENRGEKILDIHNPDITDKILDAIEAADLDPEQEEKLEHEFEKEIHLLTAEPRLKSVARDFVSHYSDLWTSGRNIDFTRTRNYYVSSFCKNYDDDIMKKKYGECVYGYKNDRLVELLAPIHLGHNEEGLKYPAFSQVIAFDVLYDKEMAEEEILFLCKIISLFKMDDSEKHDFLEEIMQYWILSVKDENWEKERERRYVIFMYDGYDYIDIAYRESDFMKVKTTVFLLPDFILGKNPAKYQIRASIDNKRQATAMKDYNLCPVCLSADFDSVLDASCICKICGNGEVDRIKIQGSAKRI